MSQTQIMDFEGDHSRPIGFKMNRLLSQIHYELECGDISDTNQCPANLTLFEDREHLEASIILESRLSISNRFRITIEVSLA